MRTTLCLGFVIVALVLSGAVNPTNASEEESLHEWDNEDVCEWLKQIGLEKYRDNVAAEKIDGPLLLLLNELEVEKDLGIADANDRKVFMDGLHELHVRIDKTPKNLWEFRSANRAFVNDFSAAIQLVPRASFLWLYRYDSEGIWTRVIGQTSPGFWLGFLFAPNMMIAYYATTFWSVHWWIVTTIVVQGICGTAVELLRIHAAIATTRRNGGSVGQALLTGLASPFAEGFKGVLTIFFSHFIFKIVPWFLSDLFFNLFVFLGPIGTVLGFVTQAKEVLGLNPKPAAAANAGLAAALLAASAQAQQQPPKQD